jgi:hypothetical protein
MKALDNETNLALCFALGLLSGVLIAFYVDDMIAKEAMIQDLLDQLEMRSYGQSREKTVTPLSEEIPNN